MTPLQHHGNPSRRQTPPNGWIKQTRAEELVVKGGSEVCKNLPPQREIGGVCVCVRQIPAGDSECLFSLHPVLKDNSVCSTARVCTCAT